MDLCSTTFVWAFLVLKVGASLTITSTQNLTVSRGATAAFSCQTDVSTYIRWYFLPNGSATNNLINKQFKINPSFIYRHNVSFDSSTGRSVLSVRDVQLNDAGTYLCSEDNTSANDREFKLYVGTFSTPSITSESPPAAVTTTYEDHPLVREATSIGPLFIEDDAAGTPDNPTRIIVVVMGLLAFCMIVCAVALIVVLRRRNTNGNGATVQVDKSIYNTGPHKLAFESELPRTPHSATLTAEHRLDNTLNIHTSDSFSNSENGSHTYSVIPELDDQTKSGVILESADGGYSGLDPRSVRESRLLPPPVYSGLHDAAVLPQS